MRIDDANHSCFKRFIRKRLVCTAPESAVALSVRLHQGKVGKQFESGVLAFLRMKLHTANLPARADRRVTNAVIGHGQHVTGVFRFDVIRVNKVKVGSVGQILQKRMRLWIFDLIPPNLRDARAAFRKAHHGTMHQPETFVYSELSSFLEHQLKTDT